ncbi:unnamed protein product [Clonostachys rosea f. rosea IK726]|uniref:Rhodopsin domain-containing protein n=2 Tax=Bionectria ochroleuca TaxID=29856 RepID=A0A0B7KP88_BIOOC|nr:unnamed protein product [Clonostachys rosea f. rosea IK726]
MDMPAPVNPDDPGRGIWFMGLTWTLSILSLLAVAVRFWVRLTVTMIMYAEDWIMLFACLLNLAAQSLLTVAFHYGLGKHDQDLTFDQIVNTGKWIWMSYTPAILSSATARISIMILLVRIFGPKHALKWLVIVTTTLSVAAVVAQIITVWNQMKPVEGLWNPLAGAKLQFSPDIAMIEGNIIGALFAFGDLVYVLAPVLVVWKLNMPFRQKLGLCILLSLSLVTMGISIAKSVHATSSAGSLYGNTLGLFFAIVEQTIVIILGCAPPLSSVTKLKLPATILSMSSMAKQLVGGRSRDTQYTLENSNRRAQGSYASYHELVEGSKATSSAHGGTTMETKP